MENVSEILHIFKRFVGPDDVVLDFGCGGGYMLANLNCKHKIGFDINQDALESARKLGCETYTNLSLIESQSIDIIISNSALEHTPTPFEDLKELLRCLKPGGKAIFRVPHETLRWEYMPNDWNYHLFTWSPMALGNLFNEAGWSDINVRVEAMKRSTLLNLLRGSPTIYDLLSKIYRLLRIIWEELGFRRIGVDGYSIVVAEKPNS